MTIRTASRDELDTAIEWAAQEGWNPGLHDGDAFYAADPEGFLGGFIDGEMVAFISAVSYSGEFGFIGFYIVRPDYRGHGLGLAIWNAGIQRLSRHLIGLDGVVAQQDNCAKSRFTLAHRTVRYVCKANVTLLEARKCRLFEPADFEAVADLDRVGFPLRRERFLEGWLALPGSQTVVAEHDGQLRGFGTIRTCRSGYKVGPLFADSVTIAADIFTDLCREVSPGPEVFLDIPEPNRQALELVHQFRMTPVFEVARMYTGAAPPLDLDRLFGVTTFELG